MPERSEHRFATPDGYRQSNPDGGNMGRLLAIYDERQKQEAKYPGTTCAAPVHTWTDRMTILGAEYGEAIEEAKMLRWPWTRERRLGSDISDGEVLERLRHELVQCGAIILACMERIDQEIESGDPDE